MKKITFIILAFSTSCVAPRLNTSTINPSNSLVFDGKTFSTVYQQRAAEYRALCYQAFNIAHERINEFNRQRSSKPKAIMTEIDETILNNSSYQAQQLLQGKDYDPGSWNEWTSKGEADTIPGALRFLQFASASGIEIFYVTNRGENEREGTLKNLQKFNFPNANNEHLLLKGNTTSKEDRKNIIAETHTIVLLLGDNLNDFSFLFEKKNSSERNKIADSFSTDFGNHFIVLPNPVYGDWESSLYQYQHSLSTSQKDSIIRASLNH